MTEKCNTQHKDTQHNERNETPSMMTLSITKKFMMTLSIVSRSITLIVVYAECHVIHILMLSAIMPNVVSLNVI